MSPPIKNTLKFFIPTHEEPLWSGPLLPLGVGPWPGSRASPQPHAGGVEDGAPSLGEPSAQCWALHQRASSLPWARPVPLPLQCKKDESARNCTNYSLAAPTAAETGSHPQGGCAAQRAHDVHPQFSLHNCHIGHKHVNFMFYLETWASWFD